MSVWMEKEIGPCVNCKIIFTCRELSAQPARGCCFDCQREFVFLPRTAEDPMYPSTEGHSGCSYATPRKDIVWCPSCKQELEDLLFQKQVPISSEVLKLG
jgi:hypothetical protein